MSSKEKIELTMVEIEAVKKKVTGLVLMYIQNYPGEWDAFRSMMNAYRSNQVTKFAEIKGQGTDMMERELHKIPETLFGAMLRNLTRQEQDWFGSRIGSRWFATTFREFASSDKI